MASIKERPGKNGSSYLLRWRHEGVQENMTLPTLEKAEFWKTLLEANGNSLAAAQQAYNNASLGGPTVVQLLHKHISLLTNVAPDQLGRYKKAIDHHFAGTSLGRMPVAAVSHEDVVLWVKGMLAKPGRKAGTTMRAKTLANHHGLLSAAFNTAGLLGYREGNPCAGIRLPKDAQAGDHMRFLTKEEYNALDAVMSPTFRPFFGFLVDTGLRVGEATALAAEDFDLDGPTPTVRVNKAWKEDENSRYYIGPPKTKRSRRTVPLAGQTVDLVRDLVEAAEDGLVFRLQRGGVMRSSSIYWHGWEPAWRKLGVDPGKWARVHDLRHTHASWMIAGGMDLFQLSHRLGHESTRTTDTRYAHLMPSAQKTGAALAASALAR
ncbi:integrase [Arthrobacter sp. SORGH_AS 212]|uniref:tyrosine-type recombinase/integrase n=1 Tax=Pseudarthrobacter sp. SORGH_AS 212 TaxID=3041777 RepID=UPI0027810C44|nr:integrase [Arthrobacter sp. SORGH_AS_0212]